jgi:hypothetical protein
MTATSEASTDRPSNARIYDYYLGGTDNFPVDRVAAEQLIRAYPHAATTARQNHAFMERTVRYLAGTVGISQFLDIGTGIPTAPNPHLVAQSIVPAARVVYVDNDPDVFAHARQTSSPTGRVTFVEGDVRDVGRLLETPELRATLDLSKPVALSMLAVIHLIPDEDAYRVVRELVDALPTGSYFSISQATIDFDPAAGERFIEVYRKLGLSVDLRTKARFSRFFDGLELVSPGVQVVHRWRPEPGPPPELTDAQVNIYGALARKA